MNEILFFFHILIVVALTFGALRLGKEALVSVISLFAVLANLFVLKQMELFGWNVTCSDVFAVGGILGLNLLQEYYDKQSAVKAVWVAFFCMATFGILAQLHLSYAPSLHDFSDNHYQVLLSFTPRLLVASLASFLIVQQIDVAFYALLKRQWSNTAWQWRNSFSLFFTQLLDTVLFSFLGLYGIVNSLLDIIIISYAVKLLIILSIAAITTLSKRVVRHEV